MPKAAQAVLSLPGSVLVSLELLGEHLRLGRLPTVAVADEANINRILRISPIRLRIYLIQNFEFHIKKVPISVLFLILILLPVFFD